MSPPPSTRPTISESNELFEPQALFRRTILSNPSTSTLSLALPSPPPSTSLRITVNLPTSNANLMSNQSTSGFHLASSRQPPAIARRLGGIHTPPIAASGSNRVPILARRRPSMAGGPRTVTYSKPFPLPNYLRHSSYAASFFTTPGAESPFEGNRASAVEGGSLSEGLGAGIGEGAKATILLPTCWDADDRCSLIELGSDGLEASFAGSAKNGDRDAAAVRTNRSIPPQTGVYYFEITVIDKGHSGYIGIGLSHRAVSLSRLPGWEDDSWGYHGDDGRAFCCLGTGEAFGPTFTTGDVIGCGVDWTEDAGGSKLKRAGETAKQGARVFFTKNGEMLGYAFSGLQGNLYPSVGLRTPGEIVTANFGATPFSFDIDALVRARQRSVLSSIASISLPPSLLLPAPTPSIPSFLPPSSSERLNETLQSLIASYLIHHGYASTAQSFLAQISLERRERAMGLVPGAAVDEGPEEALVPESDSVARGEIRKAFLAGEAERVLELTKRSYPAVLLAQDESGGMMFKLRLRAFIEAVLRSGRDGAVEEGRGKGRAADEDVEMVDAGSSLGLDALLELGRALHADYSGDERPKVQESLGLAFSLMAYERPEDEGGKIGWLLSDEAREALADELNSAILVSQSLPPKPHLESLYRHAGAAMKLLGDLGAGSAALVNVREELLGPQ